MGVVPWQLPSDVTRQLMECLKPDETIQLADRENFLGDTITLSFRCIPP